MGMYGFVASDHRTLAPCLRTDCILCIAMPRMALYSQSTAAYWPCQFQHDQHVATMLAEPWHNTQGLHPGFLAMDIVLGGLCLQMPLKPRNHLLQHSWQSKC
jgi:hypothetical protein